jgi:hypothetical protein
MVMIEKLANYLDQVCPQELRWGKGRVGRLSDLSVCVRDERLLYQEGAPAATMVMIEKLANYLDQVHGRAQPYARTRCGVRTAGH